MLTSSIVAVMPSIASTASLVAPWIWAIRVPISLVASAVWLARLFTSRGHHGEAAAGLTGARGLDGGVERQQVGLRRDARDQLGDVLDLLGAIGQRPHDGVGAARAFDRTAGDLGRTAQPDG